MNSLALLELRDTHVAVEGKEVVRGVNLSVNKGEIHAIMGKNGSGKSSLSNAIMGHPNYTVTKGDVLLNGKSVLEMEPDARSRAGLFLAFQYPLAIPGVTVANFLRTALIAHRGADADMRGFRKELYSAMDALEIDHGFAGRYVNDGFSGGEKKRLEILQMRMLSPLVAILDETDSGLDIDALRIVSEGINQFASPDNALVVVTHYQRALEYIKPHFVHVMLDGKIVKTGGPDVARDLEAKGYEGYAIPRPVSANATTEIGATS